MNQQSRELFSFISASPSPFHVVKNVKEALLCEGYCELFEHEKWNLEDGGKYFVVKNQSSIIAFSIPKGEKKSFMIAASHSDSPSFKIKPNAEKKAGGDAVVLSTECYGGGILNTWFDRPLSVAGRAVVKKGGKISPCLFNIDRDLLIIPNVAIHFNREVNSGVKILPNVDTLPLYTLGEKRFEDEVKEVLNCDEILSFDAYLYPRQSGVQFGAQNEFIAAPKLDDLMCVFATLKGFLSATESESIPVLAVFDNEEVGSSTKQGAASSFLRDTVSRVCEGVGINKTQALAQSFMVSADNAHAVHPNHPEFSDLNNAPKLNGGVVIKYNANQSYSTDAVSGATFKSICDRCGVPTQVFLNRSDLRGGSTLGSIADTMLPVMTVDIGLAQLAMHSCFETAGAGDLAHLVDAMNTFFSLSITKDGDDVVIE